MILLGQYATKTEAEAALAKGGGDNTMIDILEEMIKDASKRAEKCFKKYGEVATQYLALYGNCEWITFDASFSNAMERDISRTKVRALFEERNVQRYIHAVAEAWVSSSESKEAALANTVAPADDPRLQKRHNHRSTRNLHRLVPAWEGRRSGGGDEH